MSGEVGVDAVGVGAGCRGAPGRSVDSGICSRCSCARPRRGSRRSRSSSRRPASRCPRAGPPSRRTTWRSRVGPIRTPRARPRRVRPHTRRSRRLASSIPGPCPGRHDGVSPRQPSRSRTGRAVEPKSSTPAAGPRRRSRIRNYGAVDPTSCTDAPARTAATACTRSRRRRPFRRSDRRSGSGRRRSRRIRERPRGARRP